MTTTYAVYAIYADGTSKKFNRWPDLKDAPKGTYVYEPDDEVVPWVVITTEIGSVARAKYKDLPDYCKAWALLLG